MRSYHVVAAACLCTLCASRAEAFEFLRFFGLHVGPGYHAGYNHWGVPNYTSSGYSRPVMGYPIDAHTTVYPGYSGSVNRVPAHNPQPTYRDSSHKPFRGASYSHSSAGELTSNEYYMDDPRATSFDGATEAYYEGEAGMNGDCGACCESPMCCDECAPKRCRLFGWLADCCKSLCRRDPCETGCLFSRRRSCFVPCRDFCPACDCEWCKKDCCGSVVDGSDDAVEMYDSYSSPANMGPTSRSTHSNPTVIEALPRPSDASAI